MLWSVLLVLLLAVLLLGGVAAAQTATATPSAAASAPAAPAVPAPEAAIRALLEAQAKAWNRGDLPGYMQGYWHSDELTFFSGAEETRGWEKTLRRYQMAYRGKERPMGQLGFSGIQVEMLGPEAAFVRGRWQLHNGKALLSKGCFTLIFKHMPEGWRIVHDHSSAG
jgi:beta-aspartyl-peptidase (threonine type)